jgi:glycosyltransferase involved in cell wall biosynthesis
VRDEEAYIGDMIESIAIQEVLPSRWIIVDDGSRDKTAEIVAAYSRRFPFIELLRLPARDRRQPGGEEAIPSALRNLEVASFDFIARFDGDLLFFPNYISRMLGEFGRDSKLGIAGGGLYLERGDGLELEKSPEYHVRGALKMYRRECLSSIGGITTQIGWDTIDEVSAWTKGWKTKSFFALKVIHRRPTGDGINTARIYRERGRAEYLTWSHPLFVFAKALKLAATKHSLLKPVCFLIGFCMSYLRSERRIVSPAFVEARREQQVRRMIAGLTLGKGKARGVTLPN